MQLERGTQLASFGVERLFRLGRLVEPDVRREEVEECVKRCIHCRSIDPAPMQHETGGSAVENNLTRSAVNTTHHESDCYLAVVDCGPSRFAVCKRVRSKNSKEASDILEELFRKRRPPSELFMDNSTAFRSHLLVDVCSKWKVCMKFPAYRASGNGVVERKHRTIKRRAARREGPV